MAVEISLADICPRRASSWASRLEADTSSVEEADADAAPD